MEGVDPGGGAFALFLRPQPGAFRQLMRPQPGEFAQCFEKNANARGLARGGWALLELTDALSESIIVCFLGVSYEFSGQKKPKRTFPFEFQPKFPESLA